MGIKQKAYSNEFLRNVLATFGFRTGYTGEPGGFTPYFSYKIAPYQKDYHLYFSKEPFALRYQNEIFNKLLEYQGYDIIRYLEFHYSLYPDKPEFIRFLQYELTDRLKRKGGNERKLQAALEWINEKQVEGKRELTKKIEEEQTVLKQELKIGVQTIIANNSNSDASDREREVQLLIEKLSGHIERLMKTAENDLRDLTSSFNTGTIEFNNRNHEDALIQLLVLLQNVQASATKQKGEQLFKKFSSTDIAAILMLHFAAFKDKKTNTLQKKVGEQAERLNYKNPKVKQLMDALEAFFYS